MYGPGLAPPRYRRPSTALLVVLRVFFVALSLLSIGFLSWGALLRLALVTRRKLDWVLFCADMALLVVCLSLLISDKTDDLSTPQGTTGMILLLSSSAATAGYFLYADIRHFGPRWTQSPGHGQDFAVRRPPVHGYPVPPPHTAGPQATVPMTGPGTALHQHPTQPAVFPRTPDSAVPPKPPVPVRPAEPGPRRPAPARIDQVRAELDELSDYLRRHGDERGPESGR